MAMQLLPFHKPEITDDDVQSVVETLRSGWLTTGPKVKRFEEDFASIWVAPMPLPSIPEPPLSISPWMRSASKKGTR